MTSIRKLLCALTVVGVSHTSLAQDAAKTMPYEAPPLLALELIPAAVQNTANALFGGTGAPVKYFKGPGTLVGVLGRGTTGSPAVFYTTVDGQQLIVAQVFDLQSKTNISQLVADTYGPALNVAAQSKDAPEANHAPITSSSAGPPIVPTKVQLQTLTGANYIETGKPDAPLAYVFVEPQCVHCRRLWSDVKSDGDMRIRWIPISVAGDQSDIRAIYALSKGSSASLDVMFSSSTLPADATGQVTNGASRLTANNAIYEALKLDGTPAFLIPTSSSEATVRMGYSGKKRN